ncbi:Mov34/MPN/PAD-1 family protein [Ornithinibacillus salinisoli]|uniref:Mov34/MPN/PAD-1 family protein n=1 Tax=Ornithinibacillus salinisoli TaxID=1848459 RepID=A0ABW4W7E7_9BACI
MEFNEINLSQSIYEKMVENGREKIPYEACGLLSGNGDFVRSVWPLDNEVRSKSRYFVSEQEVDKVIRKIMQLEEQVLAIYHTHPTTAPVPSRFDLINHPDTKVNMVIISYKFHTPIMKWYHIQGIDYTERLFYIKPS